MPEYHTLDTPDKRKHFNELVMQRVLQGQDVTVKFERPVSHRTPNQNNAMWKLLRMVAKGLQDAGIDARKFFKPEVEIPVTPEMLHTEAFNVVAMAMFGKTSSDLSTTEMSEVGETFIRHVADSHGLVYHWPSREGPWEDAG